MPTLNPQQLAEQMAQAIGGLPLDVTAAPGGRPSREVKYWKMCTRLGCVRHQTRRGWIVLGPTRRSDRDNHAFYVMNKHMEELPDEYGVENLNAGDMTGLNDNGEHRFVPILRKGGLAEFPAEQIVALGWHHLPVIIQNLTPEQEQGVNAILANVKTCQYGCVSHSTGRPSEFYTEYEYAKHLKINHKDAAAPEAVGKQMSAALERVSGMFADHVPSGGSLSPDDLAKLVAATIEAYERAKSSANEPAVPRVPRNAQPASE